MRQVDVSGIALEARTGAPLVVLRERAEPHRLLPIFLGAPEASAIALAATGQRPPQPLVHDVMAALVRSLDGTVERIEVTGSADGAFVASIAVDAPGGTRRVGSRPSDALALAVRMGAPIWVADDVLDVAGALPEPDTDDGSTTSTIGSATNTQIDPAQIEEAVHDFRSFLDDVSPADFIDVDGSSDADTADDGDVPPAGPPPADADPS